MVPRNSGLIVNVSSIGALIYLFNCAYGSGKAGVDKMAHDCAQELKRHNVTMVSLWPGPVRTEKILASLEASGKDDDDANLNSESSINSRKLFENGETLEFSGRAVAKLAADPNNIKKTGRVLLTADLAREYGLVDDNGLVTGEMREIRAALAAAGWTTLAAFVPRFLRIPHFFFYMGGYKF